MSIKRYWVCTLITFTMVVIMKVRRNSWFSLIQISLESKHKVTVSHISLRFHSHLYDDLHPIHDVSCPGTSTIGFVYADSSSSIFPSCYEINKISLKLPSQIESSSVYLCFMFVKF